MYRNVIIFRNFLLQKSQPPETPAQTELSETAASICKLLQVPCEVIPPSEEMDSVLDLRDRYLAELERGRGEGYHPVYIAADALLLEILEEYDREHGSLAAFRSKQLAEHRNDHGAYLNTHAAEVLHDCIESGYGEDMLYAPCEPQRPQNLFHGVRDGRKPKTLELILVRIPTKHPWEIPAWVPFGGWNDCPDSQDMMKALQFWYENYSAVPAVITHDILELYLPEPVTDADTCMAIAKQQFGFCVDIVTQGCGSLTRLAAVLKNSRVWYFWWD